ncbi:MAG: carbohydrate ABC transporter permease [Christensenellales bacterium]|jgi:ABC-type glycerol-3-phosphate transport system permease component
MTQHLIKRRIFEFLKHFVIIILLIITFCPLVVMVIKSFKNMEQNMYTPFLPSWPIYPENYTIAWLHVGHSIANSMINTIVSTLIILALAAMGAYVFGAFRFPGKDFLYFMVISLLMIPGILTLVPMFLLSSRIGILNTKLAIILPGIRAQLPFGVFLLTAFVKGLSREIFEAAEIDGAGMGSIFVRIVVPLIRPMLATLAILCVLFFWNDIIWPNIALMKESEYTIAVALKPFTDANTDDTVRNYGPVMAAYVIVSIPLLVAFFCASNQFIEGMTSGALKM